MKEKIDGVHQETGAEEPSLADSHLRIRENLCKLTKSCEGELGLAWDSYLRCFGFTLSASYYFAIWFDQNDFKNITFTETPVTLNDLLLNFPDFTPRYGNLTMHGLILKMGFSF